MSAADIKAARLGSEGGGISAQRLHTNTASMTAQPRRMSTRHASVVQLRLFALDGVWTEPYTPACARRRKKAAAGGGWRALS